jgi:hypothetical protein
LIAKKKFSYFSIFVLGLFPSITSFDVLKTSSLLRANGNFWFFV